MALETRKQITLTGNSKIEDQVVVSLTATIPDDTGVGNVSQYVQNTELYEKNKTAVRKDVREFQDMVYAIEDEIAAEEEAVE